MKFSDGEPFNAEAVCANFDRMFNQKGAAQTAAEYWGYFFGSFSDKPESSLYKSCEAKDESTAVIDITRATSSFPTILSLDSFSMQSPEGDEGRRRQQRRRRRVRASSTRRTRWRRSASARTSSTSTTRPTRRSRSCANDAYYGEKPKTAKIVFKIIPDESTRRQELQAGSIDGYDLPNPVDWKGLEGRRQQGRGAPGVQHPLHGPEPEARTRS